MNKHHLIFLNLLEAELGNTILPAAGNDASRRIATLAELQMSRVLVEATVVPQLHAAAITAYNALLPALRTRLEPSLYGALETTLGLADQDWPAFERLMGKVTGALLAGDESSWKLTGQLLAVDSRVRTETERVLAARTKSKSSVTETAEPVFMTEEQQVELLDFIKKRFPSEVNLRIASVKPLFGGFSKQTWFIDLIGNTELPTVLVMRRDSPYFTATTSVVIEYPVLQKMYAAGVPVPRPYAVDDRGEVLGTPFLLLGRIIGRNLGDFLTAAEQNRKVAIDMARKIARLHSVSFEGLENVLDGGSMTVVEFIKSEIEKNEATWAGVAHHDAYIVHAAIDWLKANIALADGRRTIVHRDIGLHNMLVHDDQVAAFLDWETVVIGSPVEDIAYLYYIIPQMADWNEFVAAYEEAAHVKLDRRQLDFYVLFTMMRTGVGVLRYVDSVFGGTRSNLQLYYNGSYMGQTVLQRIAAKLAEVLA